MEISSHKQEQRQKVNLLYTFVLFKFAFLNILILKVDQMGTSMREAVVSSRQLFSAKISYKPTVHYPSSTKQ